MATRTYYIENRGGEFIQHDADSKVQLRDLNNNLKPQWKKAADIQLPCPYLIEKTIEIDEENEKILKWVGVWSEVLPFLIPEDWEYIENHVRMLVLEEEVLKKKNGVLADLVQDMQTRKVPYLPPFGIEGVYFIRPYFSWLEKDDGFEINSVTGKIENNDSKFQNVIIETFGSFSEDANYIWQNEL